MSCARRPSAPAWTTTTTTRCRARARGTSRGVVVKRCEIAIDGQWGQNPRAWTTTTATGAVVVVRGRGMVRSMARARAGATRARAATASGSEGSDRETAGGDACDVDFMKRVNDEANAVTTPFALQAVVASSCALAAVILYVALDLGSTAFVGNAGQKIVDAMARSGFTAAFALIFVSELGDKTFFIAALLAMRLGRLKVLLGATSALAAMTVISVAIGRAFQSLPASMKATLPVGEYAAVAMLVFFGVKTLKEALETDPAGDTPEAHGELASATEVVCKSKSGRGSIIPGFAAMVETFTLIFIAEWGDRSMLATIALGAAQNPVGVACGATLGHFIATLIAVVGGSLLSKRISERTVGIIGGLLFLAFAVFTWFGVF